MIVVDDRDDLTVLWQPRGTVRKVPVTPASRERPVTRTERLMACLSRCDWVFADREWDIDNLWLMRPGDWSAIWVGWRPAGESFGWYVNLQEPFRRTARGFQMMDLMLDETTAETVRAEAARVIAEVQANRAPFCDGWHQWRSDPDWGVPVLPEDWARF